jgi:hypothetical protein
MLTCELNIQYLFGLTSKRYIILYLIKLDRACILHAYCWRTSLNLAFSSPEKTKTMINQEVQSTRNNAGRCLLGASSIPPIKRGYPNKFNMRLLKGVSTRVISALTGGVIYDSSDR